jgi:hypothetical protein
MRWSRVAGVCLAMSSAGCASQSLPLQHVVVYRNGIAYFERAGHVDSDQVRLRMPQARVGDFLATVAVVEKGGSSVRAAALPLGNADGSAVQTVALTLDGKGHDLQVGYVTEAPIWKPSYRMILRGDGRAELQAWGVVQNLSGEDWKNVHLSLAGGAPVTFKSDLDSTVTPARPVFSDTGEVIYGVPPSEQERAISAMSTQRNQLDQAIQSAQVIRSDALTSDTPRAPLATLVQGSSVRYDLAATVSIPDKSTTMVMFLSRGVPGETSLLYAPNEDVPQSATHPFRVFRFTNDTGAALEPGPMTVLEQSAFVGQGVLDEVAAGVTVTVPFAVEGTVSVGVAAEARTDGDVHARLTKIEQGVLTIERDTPASRTRYRVHNGGGERAKVLVKHTRTADTHLFEAPEGTHDDADTHVALVPVAVDPHGVADLVVDERTSVRGTCDWFSPLADKAVQGYLHDTRTDPEVVKKLAAAWVTRAQYLAVAEQRDSLRVQAYASKAPGTIAELNARIALRETELARLAERFKESIATVKTTADPD